MSDPATAVTPGRRLRVTVFAADAMRRVELRKVVLGAGHDVVDSLDAADVVLADGDYPALDDRPVVALGGADSDHAGVLTRHADPDQINAALRAAAVGLIVRSPVSGAPGFHAMNENGLQTLLTPREIDVLTAIAQGLTNKAVARQLNISLHTVKFHVESLFRKLGVRTRSEAVAKAAERLRSGTIEL
jgi:DNA-binding CsgD family transcriptional regulator